MLVFLILPAVAWEELRPMGAARRGCYVLKSHISVFSKGFILTDIASFIVLLPAMLTFYISMRGEIHLPDEAWVGIIIYASVAWSMTFFMEQIYAAQLYLWHLKWSYSVKCAQTAGTTPPLFQDIPQPLIMDDIPEFAVIGDPAKEV